jgi:hypothetical protein
MGHGPIIDAYATGSQDMLGEPPKQAADQAATSLERHTKMSI